MSVFVDTSAVLAMLDADEAAHVRSAAVWKELVSAEEDLVTTSYVVVELFALVQRRLGIQALRALESVVMPLLTVVWVDEVLHRRAVAALLVASRKKLSLVDCVSFEVMREKGIRNAFSLDRHFAEQGFALRSGR